MIHLEQNGKRNCGQTCVAMLTGMSIDEVCCRMGKKGTHVTSYVTLTPRIIKMSVDPKIYLEQLQQLAKRVVWDGDLISKSARSALILEGMAGRWNGFNFITEKGIRHLVSTGLMPDLTQYRLVRK